MLWTRSFAAVTFLYALSAAAQAAIAPNAVPIQVGGSSGELNVPYVSVTICAPGTDNCQTIDHIMLDSGSTGLRIFSSLVSLNLPAEKDSSGKTVAECMSYGGGQSLWGSVVSADVVLGSEKAPQVSIQLLDNQFASVPSDCASPVGTPAAWGGNGILGVSPAANDCAGGSCPDISIEPYFVCDGSSCSNMQPSPDQMVQNPVAHLPTDNNGVAISFPAVSPGGQVSVQGTLFLGIGTQPDNTPSKNVKSFMSTYNGLFVAVLSGKEYWTLFDTGTQAFNLPSGTGAPSCTGAVGSFLCPASPTAIAITLAGITGASEEPVSFQIGNVENENASGFRVSSDAGMDWGREISEYLVLGMPFFYGKTIYLGIDGKSTPLGNGPLSAF